MKEPKIINGHWRAWVPGLFLTSLILLFACDKEKKNPGPDTTPPGFPTAFSVQPNGNALEITWTMPSDSDLHGALLLRQAEEGPDGEPVQGTSYETGDEIGSSLVIFRGHSQSASFIDTPPASGIWCYRVFVFDTSYNYAGSVSRCVDTSPEDTEPPVFSGLADAEGVSNTQVTLTWEEATDNITASEDIVYEVYQAQSAALIPYGNPTYVTSPGVTRFTVFGLTPGTTYWFAVRARDAAGNLDANTLVKEATTLSGDDVTPPVFSGLVVATAVSGSQIDLFWGAATDDVTPQNELVYDVFRSTSSGGHTFGSPAYTTLPGVAQFSVTGLTPSTTYYFVVRARDAAGNSDANTVERSATTLTLSDTTPPVFAGLGSATAVSDTQIQLNWEAASDNETAPNDIVYHIYRSSISGSYNFGSPVHTTSPGATSFTVGGLSPSSTHYFVVRAQDAAGNRDTNTVERSATTLSGPDTVPPNFTGVLTAVAQGSFSVKLTWNAAVDNVTPASGIVYDVYHATSSGAQNFAVPSLSTPAGATEVTVTGLASATTYFFVVRARDAAGNRDVNLIERSATTDVADVTPPVIVSDNFSTGSALVSGTTGFVASVTFSEAVTGVNASNITINHGAVLSDFSTSDGISWNFTASGLLDGTRYTVLFGSGIQDLSSNALAPTVREIYVAASVLYVRPGGSGVQDGTSPAHALPLVSQALSIAAPGTDVYVQGGNYSDSFNVREGVNIYGGYDASFTVRDPVNNESLITQSAFSATVVADGTDITTATVIDGLGLGNGFSGNRAVLRVSGGAGLTMRNSRLFLPAIGCYTQDVVQVTSGSNNQLVLENNEIHGGGMLNNSCSRTIYGVHFNSAGGVLRMDGNTVLMGTCLSTSNSYSYDFIAVRANGHTVEIVNNVIDANGSGTSSWRNSYGIYHTTATAYRKLVIANNTISGGAGADRTAIYLVGSINALHDVRIGNNVLFTDATGSSARAIYRTTTTGFISRVENNMFTAIGVYLYSGASYTTLSSMEAYLNGVGTVASFNKEVAAIPSLAFADYAGRDWRPTASSPLSLTQGGRDTTPVEWGSVLRDRLGQTRTPLVSIGAHEFD